MSAPAPATRLKPLLALVGGAAAIGFAPIFVRLSEVGLNATAFWRLALSLPVFWLLCQRTGMAAVPVRTYRLLGYAGLFFSLDLIFWHASIARTSVANATLLANLAPVVVVIYYWLAMKQRPAARFLLGAALALAGTAGLTLGGIPLAGSASGLAGDVYGLMTAVVYAGYLLTIERSRSSVRGLQAALVSSTVAMAITGAVALSSGEIFWPASATGWAVVAGLALLCHVLGQGTIIWALGQLPAPLSSVVILVQPVVAAGLGWLWLGESFGFMDVIFAALVLAGILICRRE
jgi:drug/metabolite transporter (DMT)-like permease